MTARLSGDPRWQQRRERGSPVLIRVMIWICLHLGRTVARLLVWPITVYFWAAAPRARAASREFLARAEARPVGALRVFEHLRTFANCIVDRVYFIADRFDLFDTRFHGVEAPDAIVDSGRGFVMFGAHLGSFEAMRACVRRHPGARVYMMMDNANAAKITAALEQLNPELSDIIIDAGRPESLIRARELIAQGSIIGILGDRPRAGDTTTPIDFLGAPMEFPRGPLLAALALRAPIYFGTALYCGGKRYEIYFDPLHDGTEIARAERGAAVETMLVDYARRLEHYARLQPLNWFNFHDVWQPPR